MGIIAESDKIILRSMEWEDTDLIIKWRNSEEVRSRFIYQKPFTRESHENWIRSMVETGKVDQFIICDRTDKDKPVGSVYIRDIDLVNNKAEYGIFIGEHSARGKGLGTEAAKLMLEYCFVTKKLHKVFLRVLEDNAAAIRSYEKAGFHKEGHFRDEVLLNGEYRDVVFMSILEEEYELIYGKQEG